MTENEPREPSPSRYTDEKTETQRGTRSPRSHGALARVPSVLHFICLHSHRADGYFRGEVEQGDAEAEAPILWPPDAKS